MNITKMIQVILLLMPIFTWMLISSFNYLNIETIQAQTLEHLHRESVKDFHDQLHSHKRLINKSLALR